MLAMLYTGLYLRGAFTWRLGYFSRIYDIYILLIIKLRHTTFEKSFKYVSVKYCTDNTIVNY